MSSSKVVHLQPDVFLAIIKYISTPMNSTSTFLWAGAWPHEASEPCFARQWPAWFQIKETYGPCSKRNSLSFPVLYSVEVAGLVGRSRDRFDVPWSATRRIYAFSRRRSVEASLRHLSPNSARMAGWSRKPCTNHWSLSNSRETRPRFFLSSVWGKSQLLLSWTSLSTNVSIPLAFLGTTSLITPMPV